MTVTVKINTDTPAGKRLEKELRRYPETVQFIEPSIVSEPIPEGYISVKDGFDEIRSHILINSNTTTGKKLIHKLESHPQVVKLEYPNPTDDHAMDIESISANDSAKLAFDRLGEKYDRKFNNKYTR